MNAKTTMRTTIRYILLLAFLALSACKKDDAPRYPHSSRVVLVYMAGDNSLGGYVWANLDGMRRGMASAPALSRTLAYVDTPGENPRLVEVTASGTKTLHTWPSPHNSASAATVREAIGLVRTLAPADRYGLVLWSHGLAWVPSWATGYLTRSKGRIGGSWPPTKHDGAVSVPFTPSIRPVSGIGATAGLPVASGCIDYALQSSPAPRTALPIHAAPAVVPSSASVFSERLLSATWSDTATRYVPAIPARMVRFSAINPCLSAAFSAPASTPVTAAKIVTVDRPLPALPVPVSWPATKWFGQDTGESPAGYLDTEQLSEAIPAGVFDYILFDACFMASVETLYGLRDKTERIVCSPAEVIADGFPYEEIMADLLRFEPDLRAVCESYYRHYAQHAQSSYRSATVSLVETAELEALAAATASVFSAALTADSEALAGMDLYRLQPLDRYRRHFLFDAGSVVRELESRGLVPASVADAWRAQLARTVPYEAHTPQMLNLPLNACCGLSMYVPYADYADLNEYYRTLGWYARCYGVDYAAE